MLSAAAACSWVRRGSRILAQVARSSSSPSQPLSSSAKTRVIARCYYYYPWSPRLVLTTGVTTRHKSPISSASSDGGDPGDEQVDTGDEFGTLSGDLRSRRSYRKSSPGIQDQCFQEREEEGDEEMKRRERRKPYMTTGSNTAYWYFLQCKRLLKVNKVSLSSLDPQHRQSIKCSNLFKNGHPVCSSLLISFNSQCTASRGSGPIQWRHAGKRAVTARRV